MSRDRSQERGEELGTGGRQGFQGGGQSENGDPCVWMEATRPGGQWGLLPGPLPAQGWGWGRGHQGSHLGSQGRVPTASGLTCKVNLDSGYCWRLEQRPDPVVMPLWERGERAEMPVGVYVPLCVLL